MLKELVSLISAYQFNVFWSGLSPSTIAVFVLLISFAGFTAIEKQAPKNKVPPHLLRQSWKTAPKFCHY